MGKKLVIKYVGLLLSMLAYFNISMQEQFDELFGELWIGKKENWTAGKNQFHVLRLNFSIDVMGGAENISMNLHDALNGDLSIFISQYKLEHVVVNERNAFATYMHVIQVLLEKKAKLMILIDEFDRFAHKLLFETPQHYEANGNSAFSFMKDLIELLKWSSNVGLEEFRSFTVGISPVVTSYPMKNITFDRQFGEMVGFTESHIKPCKLLKKSSNASYQ